MAGAVVVTGTDTNVGKTIVSAALVGALRAKYWKPIQTGYPADSDSRVVASLSGLGRQAVLAETYRFMAPCSPHFAAELERTKIDASRLVVPPIQDRIIIEAAGGVLVPCTRELLYADLFVRWNAPVILVARTTLGTINHSLLSIEALRSRRVPLLGVAFVGDANSDSETTIANLGRVKRLGRLPLLPKLNAATLKSSFHENFNLGDFDPLTEI